MHAFNNTNHTQTERKKEHTMALTYDCEWGILGGTKRFTLKIQWILALNSWADRRVNKIKQFGSKFSWRFKMLLTVKVQLLFNIEYWHLTFNMCKTKTEKRWGEWGVGNPREKEGRALKRVLTAVGPRWCQHWAYRHTSTTVYPTNCTVVAKTKLMRLMSYDPLLLFIIFLVLLWFLFLPKLREKLGEICEEKLKQDSKKREAAESTREFEKI